MAQYRAQRNVIVSNREGLHARAATEVAKLIRLLDAGVELVRELQRKDGTTELRRADGTDVLEVMSLGAAQGDVVVVEAMGNSIDETEAALDAVANLFSSGFAEDDPAETQEQ